jgi:hypothetical protein
VTTPVRSRTHRSHSNARQGPHTPNPKANHRKGSMKRPPAGRCGTRTGRPGESWSAASRPVPSGCTHRRPPDPPCRRRRPPVNQLVLEWRAGGELTAGPSCPRPPSGGSQVGVDLNATSGDWTYGELGIASFTVEAAQLRQLHTDVLLRSTRLPEQPARTHVCRGDSQGTLPVGPCRQTLSGSRLRSRSSASSLRSMRSSDSLDCDDPQK